MKFFLCFLLSKIVMAIAIEVSVVQDMNFGSLAQGDAETRVRTVKGDSGNARFTVTGDKRATYTIILPTSFTISRFGAGTFPLTVSQIESNPAAGANGNLGSKGTETIYVGGTLQAIPNNQPGGSYSGDFLIEVLY
ncbi:DUF4402 domain-containing protein [Bacteriovorax sp. Seq25_V]|uniref:DUF4402 domain-containing protein n=1 Tax=Bacteriovorax sp. Seq25_V TaxID=1201288 RepID=UPI00038A4330|nr:DUF4402 domain-containing protein [Bacteriovorax sp. Seq25_V]EQC47108.1 PF14352 domain protein [Bacteriovorax sp. Seq25_V]